MHPGLHIVSIFLLQLRTLAVLSTPTLARHPPALGVGIAFVLERMGFGQKQVP
jgi:hypothetical protein